MEIKRNILGQEVLIKMTDDEMDDAYYEQLRKQRRGEVLEYLSAIARGEDCDNMNEYQATSIMCEMIENHDLLGNVTERYMRKRDRYPDGEQEMNCVVEATWDALRNNKEDK